MKSFLLVVFYFLVVKVSFAQTLDSIIDDILGVIGSAMPVAVGVALLVFIWGVVRMIAGMSMGDSDKAITEGKQRMVWGIVALFVIVSIWGIGALLETMFFGNETVPTEGTPPLIIPSD